MLGKEADRLLAATVAWVALVAGLTLSFSTTRCTSAATRCMPLEASWR